ncbi:hypothetical protein BC938DRAFT_482303 [Jimgerdemannia flammicorona]|uniref:Transmembrane protein 198 n=1 Tax=Jimgerdemannia flammicorona TaxID=994334 RepID=A0A433QWQ3_9FUNG|nr:hypothetical protein BC938DRAFT_482303 [Jimgerdemannia flammicorona]
MFTLPTTTRAATNWVFMLNFLMAIVNASPIGLIARDVPNPTTGPFNLDAHGIVLAVLAIISGIYFCFFGYRFFKMTMFLTGFWVFGNITYIGMINGGSNQTLTLIISIIVGLLGGAILTCCWHIGLYFLAALAGYALALWILGWKSGGLIESSTGRVILIVVLIIVFVLLIIFFERWMVIISTSVIGAYLIILGIDIFAQTGFASNAASFLSSNHSTNSNTNMDWKTYIMLAAFIALAIIGIFFQNRIHGARNFRTGSTAPYGYGSKWGRRRGTPVEPATTTPRKSWGLFRRN